MIEIRILLIKYYIKKERFLKCKNLDKIHRLIHKKGEFHFFFGTVMKNSMSIKFKKMMKKNNKLIFLKN